MNVLWYGLLMAQHRLIKLFALSHGRRTTAGWPSRWKVLRQHNEGQHMVEFRFAKVAFIVQPQQKEPINYANESI